MTKSKAQIEVVLEKLYHKYNRHELIKPDPLQFVYNYKNKHDMEMAGFLASSLAYGRVAQIEKSVTKLLSIMGKSPYAFVCDFSAADRRKLKSFKHRFNTGDDISDLLVVLKKVLRDKGSMEKFFLCGYKQSDATIIDALSDFCSELLRMHEKRTRTEAGMGFKYLLSDPARGSACKRLNLFLRWMVRDDDVDAGLWKKVDPAKLVVPVDVHMGRLCKILGFYSRKTVSLKTAMEITTGFAQIAPKDPVKYDFCLSRIGIVENCNGIMDEKCTKCQMNGICRKK